MTMSKIEELIKELCPNGVEWRKLGEVVRTITPPRKLKTNEYQVEGRYIVIDQGQDFCTGYSDDEDALLPLNEYVLYGDHTCIVKYVDVPFAQGADGLKILRPIDNNCKYIYYAVSAYNLNSTEYKRHWTQAKEIEIPLPPLPIQEEIVRILDKFVEQQEQLEQLIELRKKQYEYYREELLTPKEGEEWETKTLGEIGTFVRGNGLQKTDFTEEGVGCIHYGQIYTYYGMFTDKTKSFVLPELASKLKKVEPGDIVLACTSENIEDVCKCVVWEGNDTIVTGGHSSIFKHNENPRFIAYFLKSKAFEVQKIKYAYGAKVIDIKNDDLEKVIIKLPSLDKQKQIVCALNNFESSIAELTSALETSKARYAHYRDQLLNFKTA